MEWGYWDYRLIGFFELQDGLDYFLLILFLIGIAAFVAAFIVGFSNDEDIVTIFFSIAICIISSAMLLNFFLNDKKLPQNETVAIEEQVKSEETDVSTFEYTKKRVQVKDEHGKAVYSFEGNYKVEFNDGTLTLIEESGSEQILSIDPGDSFSVIELNK